VTPNGTDSQTHTVLGQKYAFATASLVCGIACYISLLGLEKAVLALLFGWLALRSNPAPVLGEHRGWAKTGVVLGLIPWMLVPALLVWKWDRVIELLRMLQTLN